MHKKIEPAYKRAGIAGRISLVSVIVLVGAILVYAMGWI